MRFVSLERLGAIISTQRALGIKSNYLPVIIRRGVSEGSPTESCKSLAD